MDSQTPRANFCHKMNVQKNFQLKILTLRKMIAAPSGGQTKFEKKSLGANSGMFIGTKNIIVFCGHFFNSFSPVQANCVLLP